MKSAAPAPAKIIGSEICVRARGASFGRLSATCRGRIVTNSSSPVLMTLSGAGYGRIGDRCGCIGSVVVGDFGVRRIGRCEAEFPVVDLSQDAAQLGVLSIDGPGQAHRLVLELDRVRTDLRLGRTAQFLQ